MKRSKWPMEMHSEPNNEMADFAAEFRRRIEKLEAALEAERREREALPRIVIPAAAQIKRELAELAKDFELTRDAIDARLLELAESDPAIAKGIADALMPLFAKQLGLIDKQTDALQATADTMSTLAERIERIERLIAPVLRGEVKLMAQQV